MSSGELLRAGRSFAAALKLLHTHSIVCVQPGSWWLCGTRNTRVGGAVGAAVVTARMAARVVTAMLLKKAEDPRRAEAVRIYAVVSPQTDNKERESACWVYSCMGGHVFVGRL
jgi:hypothetical protein